MATKAKAASVKVMMTVDTELATATTTLNGQVEALAGGELSITHKRPRSPALDLTIVPAGRILHSWVGPNGDGSVTFKQGISGVVGQQFAEVNSDSIATDGAHVTASDDNGYFYTGLATHTRFDAAGVGSTRTEAAAEPEAAPAKPAGKGGKGSRAAE